MKKRIIFTVGLLALLATILNLPAPVGGGGAVIISPGSGGGSSGTNIGFNVNLTQFTTNGQLSIKSGSLQTNNLIYSGNAGSAVLSLDAENRILYDLIGVRSHNYNTRQLFDAEDGVAANYDTRTLFGDWVLNETFTNALVFGFDSAGAVIPVGAVSIGSSDNAGTIIGWEIVAKGTSPTCTIDVWKTNAASISLPIVGGTIMGTKPALATGNRVRSSTLTSWNTTILAGDLFTANIDACSAATNLYLKIIYTYTK